jgi:hypothetical protein
VKSSSDDTLANGKRKMTSVRFSTLPGVGIGMADSLVVLGHAHFLSGVRFDDFAFGFALVLQSHFARVLVLSSAHSIPLTDFQI